MIWPQRRGQNRPPGVNLTPKKGSDWSIGPQKRGPIGLIGLIKEAKTAFRGPILDPKQGQNRLWRSFWTQKRVLEASRVNWTHKRVNWTPSNGGVNWTPKEGSIDPPTGGQLDPQKGVQLTPKRGGPTRNSKNEVRAQSRFWLFFPQEKPSGKTPKSGFG